MSIDSRQNVFSLDDHGLSYQVRILIRHPTADLSRLTAETGVTPRLLRRKGEPRFARNGRPLNGTWPFSGWSYWDVAARDLSRLADMDVDFGIEVYPLIARGC